IVTIDINFGHDRCNDINLVDGQIVASGYSTENFTSNITCLKLTENGLLNDSFADSGKLVIHAGRSDSYGRRLILLPDNKIIAAGDNGTTYAVSRINTDGTIDSTFGNGVVYGAIESGTSHILSGAQITSENKIILSGYRFDEAFLSRLNDDGSIDSSFGENGWFLLEDLDFEGSYSAYDLKIQSDNKILITGNYGSTGFPSGASDLYIARLMADGTLDYSFGYYGIFGYGGLTAASGKSLAVCDDEKIIGAGYYLDDDDKQFPLILKTTTDGNLDNSFGVSGVVKTTVLGDEGIIYDIVQNNTGKTICVGHKGDYYDHNDVFIMQLDATGNLDTSFSDDGVLIYETEFSSRLNTVIIDSNQNILTSGYYYNVGTNKDFFTARITPDGKFDSTFGLGGVVITPLSEFHDIPYDMIIDSLSRIVVIGGYAENNDAGFGIVRYIDGYIIPTAIDEEYTSNSFNVFPNPIKEGKINLQYHLTKNEVVAINLFSSTGTLIQTVCSNQLQYAGTHNLNLSIKNEMPGGNYFLVITTPTNKISCQFIKL
ncbi:MAG: T9SS type A sorting domain-containing protein, partial [Chitinophagales bacterium]